MSPPKRAERKGFSIERLIEHLRDYSDRESIQADDLATRYRLKEAGSHYIIDHMGLSDGEKTDLKQAMSQRICAEQALATQGIPATYLRQILEGFSAEIRETKLVQSYIRVASILVDIVAEVGTPISGAQPSPFDLREESPYVAVDQEGIISLVKAAFKLTDAPLKSILNTEARMMAFNDGGTHLKRYLDEHHPEMGIEVH